MSNINNTTSHDTKKNNCNTTTQEFNKDRQIKFFASSLHQIPEPYAKLDTNRLTLVHFSVHALDILGVWDEDKDEDDKHTYSQGQQRKSSILQTRYQLSPTRIIEWIYSCLSLGNGFIGGTFVGPATTSSNNQDENWEGSLICRSTITAAAAVASESTNDAGEESPLSFPPQTSNSDDSLPTNPHPANNPNPHHQPHIAMTYCALLTLGVLGDDGSRLNRQGIVQHLRLLQRDDGSFGCIAGPSEQDMRFLYCACAISYLLGDWSGVDVDRAVGYIQSCRAYDGGVALIPGQEGHGGSTFCALAALALMGRLEEVLTTTTSSTGSSGISWKDELVHWCVHRQQDAAGGMQGRPNKLEDTCYSYWIGGSLRLLGEDALLDQGALQRFILSCQSPMGGFAKSPGGYPDILHSFYSLAWLSISSSSASSSDSTTINGTAHDYQTLPIRRLNATLGIRQDRVEHILRSHHHATNGHGHTASGEELP
jgi:prenyltransferase beta subunit